MRPDRRSFLLLCVATAIGLAFGLSSISSFAASDPDDPPLLAPDVGPATSPGKLPYLRNQHRAVVSAAPVALPQLPTRPLAQVTRGPEKKEKKNK